AGESWNDVMRWLRRLMTERASPRWNKAYGIDPQIPIRDEDVKRVREKFFAWADGGVNQSRSRFKPPLWLQIVPSLPAMMTFIAGILAIQVLGWPIWTFVFFFLGTTVF